MGTERSFNLNFKLQAIKEVGITSGEAAATEFKDDPNMIRKGIHRITKLVSVGFRLNSPISGYS